MTTIRVPAINPQVHHLVRRIHTELVRQMMSIHELERRSGVASSTIRSWFNHKSPNLFVIEAVLNALHIEVIATAKRGPKAKCVQPKPAPAVATPKTSPAITSTRPKKTAVVQPAKAAPIREPKKRNAKSAGQRASSRVVLAEPNPPPKPKRKIIPLF